MHHVERRQAEKVLTPMTHAIGINPNFCVGMQKTLCMKEKVWSLALDSFHIHDENNVEVLQCKAKTFSIHHQKEFLDTQNNSLFTLKHKPFSVPRQYYAETADGKEIFRIKDKWHFGGARQIITFTNTASTGEPIELMLSGDWVDRHATIKMGDHLVAEITRSFFNARQILGGADTYYVTIAPGMDLSLIAALCVALDERTQAAESK